MQIKNTFNTARRNTSSTILLILQAALTIAILSNLISLISNRIDSMNIETGIDEELIIKFDLFHFGADFDGEQVIGTDVLELAQIDGVEIASRTNQMPLDGSGSSSGLANKPMDDDTGQSVNVAQYLVDEHFAATMGFKFLSGGMPTASEKVIGDLNNEGNLIPVVITASVAQEVYGRTDVVGETIYSYRYTARVVGVVDRMQTPWPKWLSDGTSAMVVADAGNDQFQRIAVRIEPGADKAQVIEDVTSKLYALYPDRVVTDAEDYQSIRASQYSVDIAMIFVLSVVLVMLLAVVSLGSIGMAIFNVEKRTKAIGTRRALGATKSDIISDLMLESCMILSAAAAMGIPLGLLLNWQLMNMFSVEQLNIVYPAAVAAALMALSLVGILYPAYKASSIAPSIATRTA